MNIPDAILLTNLYLLAILPSSEHERHSTEEIPLRETGPSYV